DVYKRQPELINTLIEAYSNSAKTIIAPVYQERRGTPVLFALEYWRDELLALIGDQGARGLLERYPEQVAFLPVADGKLLWDADTPAEYQAMTAAWAAALKAGEICEED
ncbi:MAG: NTP transferase domain-containing protein, partial [Negativicutes bacterium]|nr:NTP transferase domain-containing protein [Negativicutes bacterium]